MTDFANRFRAWRLFREAQFYHRRGAYRKASALYGEVLRRKPGDRGAWLWRGVALADLGRHSEAREHMEKAAGSPVLLARILGDSAQLEQARAMLVDQEHNAHARGLLALDLIQTGDLDRAREVIEGPLPSVPWLLARLLAAIEEKAGVRTLEAPVPIEEAPPTTARPGWLSRQLAARQLRRGLACLLRDKWQEAATAFQIALSSLPDEPKAVYGLGVSLYYLGHLEEARERLREVLHRLPEPFGSDATATLGKVALELGDPSEALILLRRGIAGGAASPENYYALGLAHLRRGRKWLARRAFERCVWVGFVRQRFQETSGK